MTDFPVSVSGTLTGNASVNAVSIATGLKIFSFYGANTPGQLVTSLSTLKSTDVLLSVLLTVNMSGNFLAGTDPNGATGPWKDVTQYFQLSSNGHIELLSGLTPAYNGGDCYLGLVYQT